MSGKQVPDRMLAHAARAKGACDDFSVCRAFWSFWAPKGHDRATAGKIYDNRLRVSCIKEYNRLFNVLSVLKRYSPYSLQVNPKYDRHDTKKREQLALLSSYMKPRGYFLLLQSLVSLALHQHLLCEHVSAGLR